MAELKQLSQLNPKWANIRLGWGVNNKTTIGSHGCTITDIAMAAGLTPDEVNRLFIEHKVFADSKYQPGVFNLVLWQRINIAIPWLKFRENSRSYHYNTDADNAAVLAAIAKNGFCLVEVDFDGTPRTDDRHWVLFKGGRKQNDPWIGNETPTSKYQIKTGFVIIDKVGEPPATNNGGTMSNIYKGYDLNNPESMKVAVDKLVEVVSGMYVSKNDVQKQLDDLRVELNKQKEDAITSMNNDFVGRLASILGVDPIGFSIDQLLVIVDNNKKELTQCLNKPIPPNGSQTGDLPKTYNGKEVVGVIIKP